MKIVKNKGKFFGKVLNRMRINVMIIIELKNFGHIKTVRKMILKLDL